MRFVSEPTNTIKMQKMKQRVRWQDPVIQERGIDQTELLLDDGLPADPDFSFLVIGDSGSGRHRGHNPQRQIAELMLQHSEDCRFILHTGDVVYLVGSSEYYGSNFIEPYREFIVGGEKPRQIGFDRMVFKLPMLTTPGNHDYYDLPILFGVLSQASVPIRRLLRSKIDFDVGFRGSSQGDVYARAFLDYLLGLATHADLAQHLDRHYTASGRQGRCLRYQPKEFTRLPNRYYCFRYGDIDFFALDSNTFNDPYPLFTQNQGSAQRSQLEIQRSDLERQKLEVLEQSIRLKPENPEEAEQLDDLRTKLEHLEEMERDVEKQLTSGRENALDQEQLDWLEHRLIESWHTEAVRGRILFFHHPPYVTEATKWEQSQTLAVRLRLRRVLDRVAQAVGEAAAGRPMVDLVLNGHAHCLEYLRTEETGHADANIPWIICGGSGYSLRRQRLEGNELMERSTYTDNDNRGNDNRGNDNRGNGNMRLVTRSHPVTVARSQLFIGRTGSGLRKHRPYSAIRIDVSAGTPPKFRVHALIADRYQQRWINEVKPPFEIG